MKYTAYALMLSLLFPLAACKKEEAQSSATTDSTAVEASGEVASDYGYTTESPPALIINGAALDPLCFLNDLSGTSPEQVGDGVSYYPTVNCRGGELTADADYEQMNPYYISQTYSDEFYDDELGDAVVTKGIVGYRYVGDYNGQKAIIVYENGGGSGVFSTLALYDLTQKDTGEGMQTVLLRTKTLSGGDRCNGGIVSANVSGEGQISYNVNLTPYDMMRVGGDPEREILQTAAAQELPYCASCCYAIAHIKENKFVGITLNKEIMSYLKPDKPEDVGEVTACLDNLVKLNLEHDTAAFNLEGTQAFIREIEHTCLGRAEDDGSSVE